MRLAGWWTCLWLLAGLAACGGGGGGGGGGAGESIPPDPSPPAATEFKLPLLAAPPERFAQTGRLAGRAMLLANSPVPAGATVEFLDASGPTMRLLATSLVGAEGSFDLADDPSIVKTADQWIRVTLPDSTTLRAFATGWTEITPGSEAAVREITRLRRAGGLQDPTLTTADLGATQDSLSLLWVGKFGALQPQAATEALVDFLRFHAPWNQWLDRLQADAQPRGPGDIAGLLPVDVAVSPSRFTDAQGNTLPVAFRASCIATNIPGLRSCGIGTSDIVAPFDSYAADATSIRLRGNGDRTTPIGFILDQIGDLPEIDFSPTVGTRILFNDPRYQLGNRVALEISLKITRKTYPVQTLVTSSGPLPAMQVVLEYDVSVLDTLSRIRTDYLARTSRWWSPERGRVRVEHLALTRQGSTVTRNAYLIEAQSTSGTYFDPPVRPFAGKFDVVSAPIRHRHAIHSPSSGLIYVAADDGSPAILELDPTTLTTLRQLNLPAIARRLALSADGSRLYAGLDGGTVLGVSTATLTVLHQATLPPDPGGQALDKIVDLSVDPFDPDRVLVLPGKSYCICPDGPVFIYRTGQLTPLNSPLFTPQVDYWDFYRPSMLSWSTIRDEFLTAASGFPHDHYRFRYDGTSSSVVSSQLRQDDIGWRDIAGTVVTDAGRILDATTLSAISTLSLGPFVLKDCSRFDARSVMCEIGEIAYPLPFFVRLDHSTGAFLGTYRPAITQVVNGCPGVGMREGSFGLDGRFATPMGAGRLLMSTLTLSDDIKCGLHVWAAHGETQ